MKPSGRNTPLEMDRHGGAESTRHSEAAIPEVITNG
jgi:hypothetical protein